jgi:hypothetical protein
VIKHPKTGQVLDVETIECGLVEIRNVRDKTASGVILKETAPNSVIYGSMVRSSTRESLDEEPVEDRPIEEKQESGEERGLIPVPEWLRRK